MSNVKSNTQSNTQSNIPIFENTERLKASDVGQLNANISDVMEGVAQSSLKSHQQVLETKLQNDFAKFKNLAYEQTNEIYNNNRSNPEELQKQFTSLKKNLMRGVPFNVRDQAENWFTSNSLGYIAKAQTNEMQVVKEERKGLALSNINKQGRAINEFAGDLFNQDPDQSNKNIMAAASLVSYMDNLNEELDAKGPDGQFLFTAAQRDNTKKEHLDNILIKGIEEQFNNLDTTTGKAEFLNSIIKGEKKIKLFNEEKGEYEEIPITRLLDRGKIQKIATSMNKQIKLLNESEKRQNLEENFNNVSDGIAIPLYGDPDYKKLVNDKFVDMIPFFTSGDESEVVPTMVDFIEKHGLTSSGKNMIEGWMDTPDRNRVGKVVNLIGNLEQSDSRALDQLNSKTLSMARDIKDDLSIGDDFLTAYNRAKERYSPANRGAMDILDQEYDEETRDIDWKQEVIDGIGLRAIFGNPNISDFSLINSKVVDDFRRILRDEFHKSNANIKRAKENALIRLKGMWGASKVNNGKVTKYKPEDLIEEEDWLNKKRIINILKRQKQDAFKDVFSKYGITNKESQKLAEIQGDDQTLSEIKKGLPITYRIFVYDNFGKPFTVPDVRYSPNYLEASKELNEFLQRRLEKNQRAEEELGFVSQLGKSPPL